jgi:hypothetical protein
MIQVLIISLWFWCQPVTAAQERPLLGEDVVWMIVMSTPAGIELEARRGCPDVELMPEGRFLMYVQLRNACPSSGSGLIDNYTVDLRTGQVWTGIDDKKYIESERLRRLRALLGIAPVSRR